VKNNPAKFHPIPDPIWNDRAPGRFWGVVQTRRRTRTRWV